jgi:hypothetical protein
MYMTRSAQRFDRADGARLDSSSIRKEGPLLVVQGTASSYERVYHYPDTGGPSTYKPRSTLLATLDAWVGLPVTASHWFVDDANVSDYSVGWCRKAWDGNDGWIWTEMAIWFDRAIRDIQTGSFTELSPGFESSDVYKPGRAPNGEAYDMFSEWFVPNHLALLLPNTARGGRDARLR